MFDLFRKRAPQLAEVVRVHAPVRRERGDDLLTAGLGLEGLRAGAVADDAGLRQRDIHRHFRELVDVTPEGGFGRLYGPVPGDDLQVTGDDIAATLRLPGRAYPFAVRVLVPDNLNTSEPCLIVVPSSGSRGAMGSIGDIGAFALTRGYALALTDKGTGVGAHLLADDTTYTAHDLTAQTGHDDALFWVDRSDALHRFCEQHPHAVALKHLHAEENLEADWPHCVLAAAEFAKGVFRQYLPGRARFQTIAVGVSNGGGAVVRAGEARSAHLLDAIVAVEPNVAPPPHDAMEIVDGGRTIPHPGRDLYDVSSAMHLLAPIACLADELGDAPLSDYTAPLKEAHIAWGNEAARHGLVSGSSPTEQARQALEQITALGFQSETHGCMHAMVALQIWPAVSAGFAHMLARAPVHQPVAGVTIAFADPGGGPARAPSTQERAQLAARCGGLAPSGGLELIDRDSTSGLGFATAQALRALWTGESDTARRVREGAAQIRAAAVPKGLPTIILHGRGDSLINVNHTSRAYLAAAARNRQAAHLHYYEVDHAQHFETLLMLPGFSDFYTSIAPATTAALERMIRHLWSGDALPPSQRVRAFPAQGDAGRRGTLTDAHTGELHMNPAREDRIEISAGRVVLFDRD